MTTRVTVTISGQEYTLTGAEDEGYVRKLAAHVDEQIQQVGGGRMSLVDGAVLAAVNIADEYFKEQQTSENLRRQVKEALDASAKVEAELSEAKREIFKLQNRLQNRK